MPRLSVAYDQGAPASPRHRATTCPVQASTEKTRTRNREHRRRDREALRRQKPQPKAAARHRTLTHDNRRISLPQQIAPTPEPQGRRRYPSRSPPVESGRPNPRTTPTNTATSSHTPHTRAQHAETVGQCGPATHAPETAPPERSGQGRQERLSPSERRPRWRSRKPTQQQSNALNVRKRPSNYA